MTSGFGFLPTNHKYFMVRNTKTGVVAGVCAGIADSTGLPVLLIRVLFILGAIWGAGLLLYVILWIAMSSDE